MDKTRESIKIVVYTVLAGTIAGYFFRGSTVGGALGGGVCAFFYVSVPLVLIVGILGVVLKRTVNRDVFGQILSYRMLAVLSVVSIIVITKCLWAPPSRILFKRVILNPIPPSVMHLQTFLWYAPLMDHAYVFRFTADDTDIEKIIASKGFQLTDELPSSDMFFSMIRTKTPWWTPELIDSPKLYTVTPYPSDEENDHNMWVDEKSHTVYYMEFKY